MDKAKYQHARQAKITCESNPNDIRIFINDILHLRINTKDFIGLQSWYESKSNCKIELSFKQKNMLIEYNSVDKWKAVLQLLNEHI